MTAPGVFTPYSTLKPFFPATKPTWIVDELDQERILSYQIYEEIYWNVPDTFKLVARGAEDKPIYIPSGRIAVEATNRFTAPGFGFAVLPAVPGVIPQPTVIDTAQAFFKAFFVRERFFSKFAANKRSGLIHGDWLWHIVADPAKPQGGRVSIYALDPASYFPIPHPDDLDRILGCHIVEQFIPPGETDAVIKRTTYRKSDADLKSPPGGPITVEIGLFELDDWEGPQSKPVQIIRPLQPVPGITSLPVYHIRNFEEPGNPFGSSEMRGLERVIAAVNQGISDEELTLALEGLGMYATDAPAPTDDDGNEIDWILGPGKVVEHPPGGPGSKGFYRVNGVGSVAPMQDHLKYIGDKLNEASGVPDVASGRVNVSVAESGISLSLQLAPMIAKTDEKDTIIREIHDQMFYDMATQWFPTYEGARFDGLTIVSTVGDKMPVDREKRFTELNDMLDRQVISAAYYRLEAAKIGGYVFPEGLGVDVVQEKAAMAVAQDPFALRSLNETDGAVNGNTGQQSTTNPVSNGSVQVGSGTGGSA
jgi:hypothetical protein